MSTKSSAPATLMFSGGIDSVVVAYWAKSNGHPLELMYFDYGQENLISELSAARRVSKALQLPLQVFDVSGVKRNFLGLTGHTYQMISVQGRALPDSICDDPFFALGIAAEWTIVTGRELLLTGFISDDLRQVPQMADFLASSTAAARYLYAGGRSPKNIDITAPFLDKSKADVISLGQKLGVDFSMTWSCHSSSRTPCGNCGACDSRNTAFSAASVRDPLV